MWSSKDFHKILKGRQMAVNQTKIERIISLAKAYGVTRLILFGSATEFPAEARDIDLACDGVAGWRLYELAARLEEELGTSLDIIPLTPPTRFTRYIEKRGKILL
jgi:predicted nucleotidyltransferase